jgi:hypothetical protein
MGTGFGLAVYGQLEIIEQKSLIDQIIGTS